MLICGLFVLGLQWFLRTKKEMAKHELRIDCAKGNSGCFRQRKRCFHDSMDANGGAVGSRDTSRAASRRRASKPPRVPSSDLVQGIPAERRDNVSKAAGTATKSLIARKFGSYVAIFSPRKKRASPEASSGRTAFLGPLAMMGAWNPASEIRRFLPSTPPR